MSDPNNTESVVIPVKMVVDEKSVKTAEKDIAKAAEKLDKAKEVKEAQAARTRKGLEQKRQYEEYVTAGAHAQKLSRVTTQYYKSANRELEGLQKERIRFTKRTNDEIFRIDEGARKRDAEARGRDLKAEQRANQAAFAEKVRSSRQATSVSRQGLRRMTSNAIGMRQTAQAGGAAIVEANQIATGMYQTAALAPGADGSAAQAAMAAARDKAVQARFDRSMYLSGRAGDMRAAGTNFGGGLFGGGRLDRFGAAWSAPEAEGGPSTLGGRARTGSYKAAERMKEMLLPGGIMGAAVKAMFGAFLVPGIKRLADASSAGKAYRGSLADAAMGNASITQLNAYAYENRGAGTVLGAMVNDLVGASGATMRAGAGMSGLNLLRASKQTGMGQGDITSTLQSLRGAGSSKASVWGDFQRSVATGVAMGLTNRQGLAQRALAPLRASLAYGRGGVVGEGTVGSAASAYTGFHEVQRAARYDSLAASLQSTAMSPTALVAAGVGRGRSLMQYMRGLSAKDPAEVDRQVQFYRDMAKGPGGKEKAEFLFAQQRLGGASQDSIAAEIYMKGRGGGATGGGSMGSGEDAMAGRLSINKAYDAMIGNQKTLDARTYFDANETLRRTMRRWGGRGAGIIDRSLKTGLGKLLFGADSRGNVPDSPANNLPEELARLRLRAAEYEESGDAGAANIARMAADKISKSPTASHGGTAAFRHQLDLHVQGTTPGSGWGNETQLKMNLDLRETEKALKALNSAK